MAVSLRRRRLEKMKRINSRRNKQLKSQQKNYKEHDSLMPSTEIENVTPHISHVTAPIDVLRDVLSPVSLSKFFEKYWEKKPLIIHKDSVSNENKLLFGIEDFFNLLSRQEKDICYGRHVNFCRYVDGKRINTSGRGQVKLKDARRFWDGVGTTIQFHQPQHFKDNIWELLTKLETVFGCLVGANIYMTPPNSQGLAPHYDDVEVIIIQLEGRKHWRLYSPPMSLPQDYSRDLTQDEISSPTHDFYLETGDVLYFPRGTIHQADTPADTHSTHITISTYQNNNWSTFLNYLLPIALRKVSLLKSQFREGLPLDILSLPNGLQQTMSSNKSHMTDHMTKVCSQLLSELSTDVIDESLVSKALETYSMDFITSRLPPFHCNVDQLGPQGAVPQLTDKVTLCWPDYTYLHTSNSSSEDDQLIVYHSINNNRQCHMVVMNEQETNKPAGVKFPRHYEPALNLLFSSSNQEGLQVNSLPLETNELTQLVMSLWAEGLIKVSD